MTKQRKVQFAMLKKWNERIKQQIDSFENYIEPQLVDDISDTDSDTNSSSNTTDDDTEF
jgi:hypothetical protein